MQHAKGLLAGSTSDGKPLVGIFPSTSCSLPYTNSLHSPPSRRTSHGEDERRQQVPGASGAAEQEPGDGGQGSHRCYGQRKDRDKAAALLLHQGTNEGQERSSP